MIKCVCVFCGSAPGHQAVFVEDARRVGRLLAEEGMSVVTGAGGIGLMGNVANAALEAGGEVIGIIPERLLLPEVAHTNLTRREVVPDMHRRKARMTELSDAFIVLPGGLGTMDELFEIWGNGVLGYHKKPVGILNCGGYYDPLLEMVERMVNEGFVRPQYRDMLIVTQDPAEILAAFRDYHAPPSLPSLFRK